MFLPANFGQLHSPRNPLVACSARPHAMPIHCHGSHSRELPEPPPPPRRLEHDDTPPVAKWAVRADFETHAHASKRRVESPEWQMSHYAWPSPRPEDGRRILKGDAASLQKWKLHGDASLVPPRDADDDDDDYDDYYDDDDVSGGGLGGGYATMQLHDSSDVPTARSKGDAANEGSKGGRRRNKRDVKLWRCGKCRFSPCVCSLDLARLLKLQALNDAKAQNAAEEAAHAAAELAALRMDAEAAEVAEAERLAEERKAREREEEAARLALLELDADSESGRFDGQGAAPSAFRRPRSVPWSRQRRLHPSWRPGRCTGGYAHAHARDTPPTTRPRLSNSVLFVSSPSPYDRAADALVPFAHWRRVDPRAGRSPRGGGGGSARGRSASTPRTPRATSSRDLTPTWPWTRPYAHRTPRAYQYADPPRAPAHAPSAVMPAASEVAAKASAKGAATPRGSTRSVSLPPKSSPRAATGPLGALTSRPSAPPRRHPSRTNRGDASKTREQSLRELLIEREMQLQRWSAIGSPREGAGQEEEYPDEPQFVPCRPRPLKHGGGVAAAEAAAATASSRVVLEARARGGCTRRTSTPRKRVVAPPSWRATPTSTTSLFLGVRGEREWVYRV